MKGDGTVGGDALAKTKKWRERQGRLWLRFNAEHRSFEESKGQRETVAGWPVQLPRALLGGRWVDGVPPGLEANQVDEGSARPRF
ncbi:hypothetical protein CLOM_g17067 [Closterium sp. NIES-68]|nr:hypothetical protein CLOM_g17067 [Closterium sp. NIES-68]